MIVDQESNLGIIWPSDDIDSSNIIEKIKKDSTVFYLKTYNFTNIEELIFDVYSFDKGLKVSKSKNILEKVKRIVSKKNKNVIFVGFKVNNFNETVMLRNNIRKLFESNTSSPPFDIFHTASSIEERLHLENIFFSKPTLERYCTKSTISNNLTSRLRSLKEWAKENNISLNDICIVGGAVIDLHGYKFCDDIDIVLPNFIRDSKYGTKAEELVPGVDIVKKNYSKKEGIGKWYSDDDLIYNKDLFVFVRGIKFASLEIVKERKNYSKRDKDIKDLTNIENNIKVVESKPVVEVLSPIKLFFHDRLDLVCKYLLFKEFEKDVVDQDILELYKKHILKRSGGVEGDDPHIPNQDRKLSVDDYVNAAKQLYKSMKETGFNKEYPVPYYNIGLENGAHRVSCAMALGINIYAIKVIPRKIKNWDERWFSKKGFSAEEIELLKREYAKIVET